MATTTGSNNNNNGIGRSKSDDEDEEESLESMISLANRIIERNQVTQSVLSNKPWTQMAPSKQQHSSKHPQPAFSRIAAEVSEDCLLPDIVLESRSTTGYNPKPIKEHDLDGSRHSLASTSSFQSVAGSGTVQVPRKFNVFSCNQSIASACADPRKSRSEMMVFFTRHWGEHFRENAAVPPLYHLPHVQVTLLANYLKAHQKKHKAHVRSSKLAAKQAIQPPSRVAAGGGGGPGDAVLASVPNIFLSSDFKIDSEEAFREVFMHSNNDDSKSKSSTTITIADCENEAQTSRPVDTFVKKEQLLDKLESYHDLIESKLTSELAGKSQQLFAAVKTYNLLSTQLHDTTACLRKLRGTMAHLNNTVVKNSFSALYLHRARENHAQLLQKLEIVSNMREAQTTVQMLLSSYNYPAALECITTAKAVLKQDLKGLVCFRHLSVQLTELESVISRLLQEEFVKLIQEELGRELTEDSAMNMQDSQLNPVFLGLTKIGEFRYCQVLQDEISTAARNLVKKTVRDFLAECDIVNQYDPGLGKIGDQMRKLNLDDWMKLLAVLSDTLLLFVTKINTIQNCLLELLDVATGANIQPEPACSSSNSDVQAVQGVRKDLVDLAGMALDSIHESLVRVLVARAKDGFLERLSIDDFMRVWEALDDFDTRSWQRSMVLVRESSTDGADWTDTARGNAPLRVNMRQHAHAFITRFHDDRKAKLTLVIEQNILDSETWRAAEVPAVFQCIVDECSRSGVLSDVQSAPEDAQSKQFITLNGDETALLLLQMTAQYCDCLRKMPFVSHELLVNRIKKKKKRNRARNVVEVSSGSQDEGQITMHIENPRGDTQIGLDMDDMDEQYEGFSASTLLIRLVELLKLFNSRSCQLLLGAGALQLVGLKTITVKNLALCSRCLQLIAYHVPFVERQFKQALGPTTQSNVVRHLQQLVTDLNNHIQEINLKLISLMDMQLSTVMYKWEFRGSVPSSSFQLIGRHIRKFHEGIAAVLPNDQIQSLLLRVHDNFKKALRNRLLEIDITPRDTATWGLVCSEFSYYMDVLRSIDCCASLNDTMNDVLAC